jgi:hypothetical protein
LPPLDIEKMPVKTKGIWPKARLWGPKLGNLSGPVLFLDLDLVIVGSLDSFFEAGGPDDVMIARNQTTPFERLGQTSLFRFPVGKLVPLLEKFRADPQGVADKYQFEQRFVTRNAPGGVKFFPRRWVLHFKQDCRWPIPLNYFLVPRLPSNSKVILFPRNFFPQHAIDGQFGIRGRRSEHHSITFLACLTPPSERETSRSNTCANIFSQHRGSPTIGGNEVRSSLPRDVLLCMIMSVFSQATPSVGRSNEPYSGPFRRKRPFL